ncbi:MAG: hypothetical protein R6X21_04780 [Candidatus Aminicenantes bacterium]
MIRKTLLAAVMLLAAGTLLAADWKTGLLSYLGRSPDHKAAWGFLAGEYGSLEGEERQTAGALLPYLAGKIGETSREEELISAYFETYRDNGPDLSFLDDQTRRDFLLFWSRWTSVYPLVYDLKLISYITPTPAGLPAAVEVGLELLNDALYRVSLGPYILEGGHWRRGFHILTVPVHGLFEREGTYEFLLDLKAGDLIVRKPIRIEIAVADVSAPAPAPRPRETAPPQAGMPSVSARAGEISLYVDGKLILKSRKIAAKPPPLSFPLPGPSMPGQKPYLPPPKNDPMASGVSIIDALALTYKAIKDLVARKPPKPSPPSYRLVDSLAFSYIRTTAEGLPSSARATVALSPLPGRVFRE